MSSAFNIADLATYIAVFCRRRLIAMAFKFIFYQSRDRKTGRHLLPVHHPVALFIFCLLFFFGKTPNNLYIFGLMAMLYRSAPVNHAGTRFFILFQPLKEKLQLKGHLISKGYMYPPSLIIVGDLLILYNADLQVNIQLAVKILLINLLHLGRHHICDPEKLSQRHSNVY